MKTLWYVEFRALSDWDRHTPLMYIPVQRTYVRGETEEDARLEVIGWCASVSIDFLAVERAPEWMQTGATQCKTNC